jgi:hypothetical protein
MRADFADVAFFVSGLAVLIGLAAFQQHWLVAKRADGVPGAAGTEVALERRHRNTKLIG